MPVYVGDNKVMHPRSVPGFCERHGICRATFYNMLKRGNAPRVMKIGSRSIIAEDAERDWLNRMQSENA